MATRKSKSPAFPLGEGRYFSFESTRDEAVHEDKALVEAQQRLEVERTGQFNDETWEAVKAFQADHDLEVSGLLDEQTWDALFREEQSRGSEGGR